MICIGDIYQEVWLSLLKLSNQQNSVISKTMEILIPQTLKI